MAKTCGAHSWTSPIRWFIFIALMILGVYFISWYVRPALLNLLAWIAFGMLWVPASFYLSKRVSQLLAGHVGTSSALNSKKPLGLKPRCPNCKTEVAPEQTLCPTCYEDLLHNCQDCGRVINAPHKVCRECAAKHRGRKLRIRSL